MSELSLLGIVALLPLCSAMLIFQTNPYHALVARGILGAVAALVYAVLGAADVALTEALVGTLLVITLYAVAVRSSMVMRLGVLGTSSAIGPQALPAPTAEVHQLRTALGKHHLRLEVVVFPDEHHLQQALIDHAVHAIGTETDAAGGPGFQLTFRVRRLYDLLCNEELPSRLQMKLAEPAELQEARS